MKILRHSARYAEKKIPQKKKCLNPLDLKLKINTSVYNLISRMLRYGIKCSMRLLHGKRHNVFNFLNTKEHILSHTHTHTH